MTGNTSIKDLVAAHYGDLTEGLQQAADYVVEQQIEVATNSLRSVAASSGLSPTTFSRLARALGLEKYEQVRQLCAQSLTPQTTSFSGKLGQLHATASQSTGVGALFLHQASESIGNIEELSRNLDVSRLVRVVKALSEARQVTLLAGSTSRGLAKYLEEMAGWISDRWRLVDDQAAALARAVTDSSSDDVYILISKSLFLTAPIRAAELAAERGAFVLVLTDSHTCPALPFASEYFVLPTESPHFFPSYAATLVLLEAIMSMLAAQIGAPAQARIEDVEASSRSLGAYWDKAESTRTPK
ncbi:MurR/RpiR family transcriptional regulator [Roseovarius sp. ZX-A-9]|uniref:MurR/RpiR family transcriptional regulator n=1 Tax=Roseovarius sp. ZX-A-9 TaxID=3014783 RepID=UPI00232DDF70|nr:MurR/RpiR family transcriptional regulator [Roseovarius sp. ZX-A-9]